MESELVKISNLNGGGDEEEDDKGSRVRFK